MKTVAIYYTKERMYAARTEENQLSIFERIRIILGPTNSELLEEIGSDEYDHLNPTIEMNRTPKLK